MKLSSQLRPTKWKVATGLLVMSAVWGVASIAISAETEKKVVAETETKTAAEAAAAPAEPADEISNGSAIQLGEGLAINGVPGWKIERRSLGMGLVMKEVLTPQTAPIDYTKPIFTRNITLVTLPEARSIDQAAIEDVKADISKMIARESSLKDFMFTDVKLFDYKGKNDGMVLFSQLTVNGFPMMQMQILVSGEKKSYLSTYSDLAANFATPATYDAAWKSMSSIAVEGIAPKRFEKEIMIGGTVLGGFLALILPFMFVRWMSARRIRALTEELQYDWDHGSTKSDADYDLSDIHSLDATRPAKKRGFAKKASGSDFDFDVSSVSAISTRHSRFV